ATLQAEPSVTVAPCAVSNCEDAIFEPFMLQSAKVPLALRNRMSARPSPLKSPMPATLQAEPSVSVAPCEVSSCEEAICEPFIVQSAKVPLELRNNTSDLPSPLKSPSP